MNLSRPRESSSFYESFSDLIFTTMAIFVFLMILFLTQVRPVGVPREKLDQMSKELAAAQANVEQLSSEVAEEQTKRAKAEADRDKIAQELNDEISTQAIELVVAADGSSSMGPAYAALSSAILRIAEEVPKIAPELSIGVAVYREQISSLPPRRVLSSRDDFGVSSAAINSFLKNQAPNPSASYRANIQTAVEQLAQWLRASGNSKAKKVAIIVGDVGPYEMGGDESENESRLTSVVHKMSSDYPNLSLLIVNPGRDPRTESFFLRLTSAAGGRKGRYETQTAEMLSYILLAIFDSKRP